MRQVTGAYLFISLLTCSLCSCNRTAHENPAGGPCTYETHVYPIKVIQIVKKDNLHSDLLFERNREGIIDTVSYYQSVHEWIKQEDLIKSGIETGKVFKWKEEKILTGSCTPNIETLLLEKY